MVFEEEVADFGHTIAATGLGGIINTGVIGIIFGIDKSIQKIIVMLIRFRRKPQKRWLMSRLPHPKRIKTKNILQENNSKLIFDQ